MDFNFSIKEPDPLEIILREIERALEAGLPYLAIQVSLSIPDVCSSLEVELNDTRPWRGVEERYVDWCRRYVEPEFVHFTAEDCWKVRGGLIHNGRLLGRKDARYSRVLFGLGGTVVHDGFFANVGGIKEPVLMLDAQRFCQTMVRLARSWYEDNRTNAAVVKNVPDLIRYRADGYLPLFSGIPVIG